jgi:hypothetical protein
MNNIKLIGYPVAGAILASLGVLLVGLLLFGFDLSLWTEWQGRMVGIAGTVLAVIAAAIGFARARKTGGPS